MRTSPPHPPTWLHSDRLLARRVGRPVSAFLRIEAAGGLLLLAGTAIALLWANSPWSGGYEQLWHTRLTIDLGGRVIAEDLRHWVNDGLMALFFFVVGLEINHELVAGRLAKAKDALLPVFGAVGGMIVPAAIYLAFNAGGAGRSGWGVPIATDIAFAVGVLALLGQRVPDALKVLLLALAIVDDLGAIVVIAVFYTERIDVRWAAAAVAGLLVVAALRRARVWFVPLYGVIGVVVWMATLLSGIHATIAGVALGLLTPARPFVAAGETVSVAERLRDRLHPWTGFVVIPLFALANAGIAISGADLRRAAGSTVAIGVVVGLVVGKFVGILGASMLAVRLRLTALPPGVTLAHLAGMAILAGIGFTVSLFIAGLAFTDEVAAGEAKLGILAASLLAAIAGSAVLRRCTPARAASDPT